MSSITPPSHESHLDAGHPQMNPQANPNKANVGASFWFGMLLIALFIAGVNFVGIMASGHGHGEEKGALHHKQETTSNATLQGKDREDVVSEDKQNPTQHHPAAPEDAAGHPEHSGH